MEEYYAECHKPSFDPILINKWGWRKKAKIEKKYSRRELIFWWEMIPFYETFKHFVYKVPEGSIVVSSETLEENYFSLNPKKRHILVQCNDPTPRAIKKAKKITEKIARKYNINEFTLEEKSSVDNWIEPVRTSRDIDNLL
ncbi:MAG: hypothetical protein J7L08_02570 [Candidatus Aenigmarchaeota archaeon]|nr:hypothetical protein [Candidatus Aenigmarchaeota archaeon]